MLVQKRLHEALQALEPIELEIKNESAAHRGHHGYEEASQIGESHFFVRIVSKKFIGLSLVEQHQLVYQLASQELANQVHALRLETHAP